MAEATMFQDNPEVLDLTAAAAYDGGEVVQLLTGQAGVIPVDLASGEKGAAQTTGIFKIEKTASIAILAGGKVYWDHSANTATFRKVNDRDFYIGRAVEDAAASASYVYVALNIDPPYDIDLLRDGVLSVPVGTAAAGGFGYPVSLGGAVQIELTATNEAQKIDLLTVDRFAVGAKGIAEFILRPADAGSTSAVDYNIGVANGTHATDFESVTEAVVFHIDGGSTAINAQSRDGTTTVTVTDTTKTLSAGSAVANRTELWIDFRDNTDIQLYVDGVNVLPSSVFKTNAATGPLGLIVHAEKTSGTATGKLIVDAMRARLSQQAS